MVNLQGFRDLVDAVGGVKLNVRSRIPVGGLGSDVTGYIEPGVQDSQRARHALVRPRPRGLRRLLADGPAEVRDERDAAPDLARRPPCPNFQDIAAASSEMVSTNLPARELDRFMGLALKAKDQKISTVSLVPPAIVTAAPDIALVHQMIADAITRAEGGTPASDTAQAAPAPADPGTTTLDDGASGAPAPAATEPKKQKGPAPVTGGSVGSLSDGYAANQAEDLAAAV